MILLIGSPCSGKSSIGRRLSGITGLPFVTLDEFIEKKVKYHAVTPGTILNDNFIDEAVDGFVNVVSTEQNNVIGELPYHDYARFFNKHSILKDELICALYCPFPQLLERNEARSADKRIPAAYMQRCFDSLAQVTTACGNIYKFNTNAQTEEAITDAIIEIFERSNHDK